MQYMYKMHDEVQDDSLHAKKDLLLNESTSKTEGKFTEKINKLDRLFKRSKKKEPYAEALERYRNALIKTQESYDKLQKSNHSIESLTPPS